MREPDSTLSVYELRCAERLRTKQEAHRLRWLEEHPSVPYGTCLCGCGKPTRLAPRTKSRNGYVKGAPMWYFGRHDLSKSTEPYKIEDRGHDTPCWVWQRATRPSNGGHYGLIYRDGMYQPAHRYYYEQRYGPVPTGLQLDHLCRETLCINWTHLEPVTVATNVQRGKLATLTLEQVKEVRRALKNGARQKTLAEQYGVSISTICSIKRRNSWKEG